MNNNNFSVSEVNKSIAIESSVYDNVVKSYEKDVPHFSINVTGVGLSYQWVMLKENGDITEIYKLDGENSPDFYPQSYNFEDGTKFRCFITNKKCFEKNADGEYISDGLFVDSKGKKHPFISSNDVVLHITKPTTKPTISTQPSNITIDEPNKVDSPKYAKLVLSV